MILRDTAKVWRRMNPTVSIKDLKEHKTGFYITEVFPVKPYSRASNTADHRNECFLLSCR